MEGWIELRVKFHVPVCRQQRLGNVRCARIHRAGASRWNVGI